MGKVIFKTCILILFCNILFIDQVESQIFGFYSITSNSVGDPAIGEAQLTVEVSTLSDQLDQVRFTFKNQGLLASSITDVYFTDGSLLALVYIDDSDPGVSFEQGANPASLPGGGSFNFNTEFSSDSEQPRVPNGVDPDESLAILFSLQPTKTYLDVLEELSNGDLVVGIHVQGFESGGSESFVSIPEPATIILLAGGFLGLGIFGWLRKKS